MVTLRGVKITHMALVLLEAQWVDLMDKTQQVNTEEDMVDTVEDMVDTEEVIQAMAIQLMEEAESQLVMGVQDMLVMEDKIFQINLEQLHLFKILQEPLQVHNPK